MRIHFAALFLLGVLFQAAPSTAAPAVSDAQQYRVWVGKFPSDRVNGKTFLELPDVQRRIVGILGSTAVRDMKEMRASFRTIEHRGWLLVSGCLPHFCVNAQWTVAINFTNGRTWVCLASLPSEISAFGSSKTTVRRKPRNLDEDRCPEGETVADQFDKYVPADE